MVEYEKYYDSNYKTHYYYDRRKNVSSWSVPAGENIKVVDMTKQQEIIERNNAKIELQRAKQEQ